MEAFKVSRIAFVSSLLISSFALTACGGGGEAETAAQTSSSTLPETPATTPTTPPTATNAAPTISGSASSAATEGVAYSFTPAAADADKDAVTFTIVNKPSWATFAAATGALTGKPAAGDVGAYANIEISATDGKATTSLPVFSITVAAAPKQSAVTLSWSPPTQNSDGSSLQDLKGYKIHYGAKSGAYTGVVEIANAGIASYVLEALPSGLNYIAMTAYNNAGQESEFSAEVTARFN